MKGSRFDAELRWLHKVRLYPTCGQERALIEILRTTRALYNALLQQRRDAWMMRRTSVSSKQQYAEITDLRAVEPRFANVYRECEDATLRRLDLAMAAFFRRIKSGEKPGYPRFKPVSRWNQIEFPHADSRPASRRAPEARAGTRRWLDRAAERSRGAANVWARLSRHEERPLVRRVRVPSSP